MQQLCDQVAACQSYAIIKHRLISVITDEKHKHDHVTRAVYCARFFHLCRRRKQTARFNTVEHYAAAAMGIDRVGMLEPYYWTNLMDGESSLLEVAQKATMRSAIARSLAPATSLLLLRTSTDPPIVVTDDTESHQRNAHIIAMREIRARDERAMNILRRRIMAMGNNLKDRLASPEYAQYVMLSSSHRSSMESFSCWQRNLALLPYPLFLESSQRKQLLYYQRRKELYKRRLQLLYQQRQQRQRRHTNTRFRLRPSANV